MRFGLEKLGAVSAHGVAATLVASARRLAPRLAVVAAALAGLGACSEGAMDPGPLSPPPGQPQVLTEVTIQYFAPTAPDSVVLRDFNTCWTAVVFTHMNASWRQWVRDDMEAAGPNEWRLTFNDVPVDQWLHFIVHDPNKCPGNEFGATRDSIVANGVLLWRVGSIPGDQNEPVGMAFRVDAAGVVTP